MRVRCCRPDSPRRAPRGGLRDEPPEPRDRANASNRRLRPGRVGVRRRLRRVGQDQAADRPAAAPDARRRGAGAHPVPDLHQGRRRGDGGAAADALGRWVTLDDAALDERLRDLRHRTDPTLPPARAALFAHVLDLPGGMRIGTIHAFCQSLLRRFPLEAALSPHFQLVEDRDADDALTEAREDHAGPSAAHRRPPATRCALWPASASADQFGRLVDDVADRPPALGRRARRWRRTWPRRSAARWASTAADEARHHRRRRSTGRTSATCARPPASCQQHGAKACAERAGRILDWLGLRQRHAAPRELGAVVHRVPHRQGRAARPQRLRQQGGDRPASGPGQDLPGGSRTHPARSTTPAALWRWPSCPPRLLVLAAPVLHAYATHKQDSRPAGLRRPDRPHLRACCAIPAPPGCCTSSTAASTICCWTRCRTPRRSNGSIAHALTAEFFAGAGARDDQHRTVFAVGDRKQSIFSFQGADADEFDRSRDGLERRVLAAGGRSSAGRRWTCRSAPPRRCWRWWTRCSPTRIAARRRGGTGRNAGASRRPRRRMPARSSYGRWRRCPMRPNRSRGQCRRPNQNAHSRRRSCWPTTLADWIRAQTAGDVMLESSGRPLQPGDVLVLVRRRNAFARALVRALKSRGVPVAGPGPPGADRASRAVQDLMALGDALLLPQDDLTFACLLTSPLGGLDDDDLMALAIGPARSAVGGAARSRARACRTGSARGTSSPRCWRGSITCRPTRCSPRRWDRWAGGRGCSRGWARRRPNRSTNC